MKRLDRLTAILIQLQSKKIVKASLLADKYDVSLRTIYRDMSSLQEAGVPIGSQEGIGYFLVDGYHLPPVMFTESEANALLIGEKLTEQLTDSGLREAFSAAMDKIRSVLPGESKSKLDVLSNYIEIRSNLSLEQDKHPVINEIQGALSRQKTVQIKYYSNYNGQVSEREVEPIGLVYYTEAWHLMAWCRMRKAYRDFRTDRIGKIMVTDNSYDREKHPGLQEHMDALVNQYTLTEVVLRFRKSFIRFTTRDRYSHGFVSEKDLGDWVELKFLSTSLDFMARWILMYEDAVQIISPDNLKSYIKTIVQNLNKTYL
jgi:predicted DNA-binding transcriptional regulator YafY